MKLFLIEDLHPDYDQINFILVRATSEEEARLMAVAHDDNYTFASSEYSSCTEITVEGEVSVLLEGQ